MEVGGQIHDPLITRGKGFPIPIEQDVGGGEGGQNRYGRRGVERNL